MAKENTPERKRTSGEVAGATKQTQQQEQAAPSSTTTSSSRKSRAGGKTNRPQIGGTAVPGAKSTQPRPPTASNNPNQQQIETYNRTMRRRMEHLGAGPYSENQKMQAVQEQRKKRVERRKQRIEERRQEIKRRSPIGKITLGRRNLYFIIVVAVIVILLIVFAVLRQMHVLG